ncbi:MAG: aldolase, partial [Arthrobacter sp.]|nr:aldolase [Arthrobacter sp.]
MAETPKASLSVGDLAAIDAQLAATDHLLERNYPGDDGSRQPVHTVYVPADRFTPSFAADWGAQAMATAAGHGGLERLGTLLG